MKYFYSHIIKMETLTFELDQLELKDDHKHELAQLVDSMVYQTVIDIVLTKLPKKDHGVFVNKLKKQDEKEIIEYLKSQIQDFEEEIKRQLLILEKELIADIKKSHHMLGPTPRKLREIKEKR